MNILIICLALVLLSSILLFIYFKSRVSKVEEKLDIMFHLVQSHTTQQQHIPQMSISENIPISEDATISASNDIDRQMNSFMIDERMNENFELKRNDLIQVSDNETYSDSDSEENNTDEDEQPHQILDDLVIGDNIVNNDNIKKIALDLEIVEEDQPIILEKKNNDEFNYEAEEDNEEDNEDLIKETMEEINYSSFKVSDLKKMCEEKDLTNYSKLRKSELIELLSNN